MSNLARGADCSAKFRIYRGKTVRTQPLKLSKFRILAINLPLGVTCLHNFYEILSFCTCL